MNIQALPDDILVKVFSSLSLLELVENVQVTCTRWFSLSYDFYLWRVVRMGRNDPSKHEIRKAIRRMRHTIDELSSECPDSVLLTILRSRKLFHFINLKKMRLCLANANDANFLYAFPSLQHLELRSCFAHKMDAIRLEYLMHFAGNRLRHLELHVNIYNYERIFRKDKPYCFPNLKTLILKGRFPDDFINAIYKASPRLQNLVIDSPLLSMEAFDDFSEKSDTLEGLNLSRINLLTQDDFMYIFGNLSNLLSLSLESSPSFTNTEQVVVFIAQACRKLEVFKISATKFSLKDEGVNILLDNCPNLRELHFLFESGSGYANFRRVAERCRKLEHLILPAFCHFTDDSLILLSQHAENLKVLHLKANDKITGSAISQIVINCRRLSHLSVRDCEKGLELNFDEFHQKRTPFGLKPFIECNVNCFRRDFKLVSQFQPLSGRNHYCPVDHDTHLERRPMFSHIKQICLLGTSISNCSLIQIARHCPELETLEVSKGDILDGAAETLVKNCVRLRRLHLPGEKLTDTGLRAIATFGSKLSAINLESPKGSKVLKISDIISKYEGR